MRGLSLSLLCCLLVLSCSSDSPSPTSSSAEEAGPWQTVSINGALYRRVAAKPTETSQADLLITIPIGYETTADGSIRLSDTVQIAGRTYTADCGAGGPSNVGDDVGDTQATATRLTVPRAGTTEYEFGLVLNTRSHRETWTFLFYPSHSRSGLGSDQAGLPMLRERSTTVMVSGSIFRITIEMMVVISCYSSSGAGNVLRQS